jgi:hypothetical protein
MEKDKYDRDTERRDAEAEIEESTRDEQGDEE